MPGSSTTPGRPGARVVVPVRVAFRLRNGVGAQGMNLYEAQWLAYALPYRRFAAVLTDCVARLGADMDRYSFVVSDLHRLLVAGLPAHCETFCTSSVQPRNRPARSRASRCQVNSCCGVNPSTDPTRGLAVQVTLATTLSPAPACLSFGLDRQPELFTWQREARERAG